MNFNEIILSGSNYRTFPKSPKNQKFDESDEHSRFQWLIDERYRQIRGTGDLSYKDFYSDCVCLLTVSFSEGGLDNDPYEESALFDELYRSVADGLAEADCASVPREIQGPLAFLSSDFDGSRYRSLLQGVAATGHLHIVWIFHPTQVSKAKRLIEEFAFCSYADLDAASFIFGRFDDAAKNIRIIASSFRSDLNRSDRNAAARSYPRILSDDLTGMLPSSHGARGSVPVNQAWLGIISANRFGLEKSGYTTLTKARQPRSKAELRLDLSRLLELESATTAAVERVRMPSLAIEVG